MMVPADIMHNLMKNHGFKLIVMQFLYKILANAYYQITIYVHGIAGFVYAEPDPAGGRQIIRKIVSYPVGGFIAPNT
jgi:hypothetical protein